MAEASLEQRSGKRGGPAGLSSPIRGRFEGRCSVGNNDGGITQMAYAARRVARARD